jgi:carbonyl reductase 1
MSQKIAVVTGANRGIGLEISRQLAQLGVHVVLTSRDAAAGHEAWHALAGEGLDASVRLLDICAPESIAALAAHVKERHGGLDMLVNNAGTVLDGFNAEVARHTIDTNYFGTLRMCDAMLPLLRDDGRIVLLSSGMGDRSSLSSDLRRAFDVQMTRDELSAMMNKFVADVAAGRHSNEGWPTSAYRVSKIGLNKLAETYAAELSGDPRRLVVNAACPGWVRTQMGGPHAPRTVEQGARTPVWLATLPAGGPTGGFFRDEQPANW